MHIKYSTSKGSMYTHVLDSARDYWLKEDSSGQIHPLTEAIPISKKKLQELIKEYPSTLLDKTYCFDQTVEKEFFDDAKREQINSPFEAEDTVIFFIVNSESGRHSIGCSSQVIKTEIDE